MSYTLPLTAVGDAVYGLLIGDATLTGLAIGGVYNDLPESPQTYPILWIELLHQGNYGGLGTQPGRKSMPGLTLRLHVFQGEYGTNRDAQLVMARAVDVLFAAAIAVDGYTAYLLPNIETIPLPDEELNGVKVQELVTNLDLIVEEAA